MIGIIGAMDVEVELLVSKLQNKKEKKRSKKGKWAVIVFILYLLSFLADLVPEAFTHIEDFINQILNGLNF